MDKHHHWKRTFHVREEIIFWVSLNCCKCPYIISQRLCFLGLRVMPLEGLRGVTPWRWLLTYWMITILHGWYFLNLPHSSICSKYVQILKVWNLKVDDKYNHISPPMTREWEEKRPREVRHIKCLGFGKALVNIYAHMSWM
jgi:hypothetical protein